MHFNNEMTMQVSCVTVIFFPDILSLVHANVNIRYSRTEWVTGKSFKKMLLKYNNNKITERCDIGDFIWQLTSYRCI